MALNRLVDPSPYLERADPPQQQQGQQQQDNGHGPERRTRGQLRLGTQQAPAFQPHAFAQPTFGGNAAAQPAPSTLATAAIAADQLGPGPNTGLMLPGPPHADGHPGHGPAGQEAAPLGLPWHDAVAGPGAAAAGVVGGVGTAADADAGVGAGVGGGDGMGLAMVMEDPMDADLLAHLDELLAADMEQQQQQQLLQQQDQFEHHMQQEHSPHLHQHQHDQRSRPGYPYPNPQLQQQQQQQQVPELTATQQGGSQVPAALHHAAYLGGTQPAAPAAAAPASSLELLPLPASIAAHSSQHAGLVGLQPQGGGTHGPVPAAYPSTDVGTQQGVHLQPAISMPRQPHDAPAAPQGTPQPAAGPTGQVPGHLDAPGPQLMPMAPGVPAPADYSQPVLPQGLMPGEPQEVQPGHQANRDQDGITLTLEATPVRQRLHDALGPLPALSPLDLLDGHPLDQLLMSPLEDTGGPGPLALTLHASPVAAPVAAAMAAEPQPAGQAGGVSPQEHAPLPVLPAGESSYNSRWIWFTSGPATGT